MAQSPGKRSLVRADFFLGQCPKFLAGHSQVRAGFHIITFGRLRGFCDFIPDPHVIDTPSEQLCDGLLIEGDALIVMEYKVSMFTTRAKYSGDHLRLRDEIAKKLVRDFA
jgi:hypothetical protein